MKATIDFDDAQYRLLKIEAARRGTTIREHVTAGVRLVLASPPVAPSPDRAPAPMPYFASLRRYAANAAGRHDLDSMRESVARARRDEPSL